MSRNRTQSTGDQGELLTSYELQQHDFITGITNGAPWDLFAHHKEGSYTYLIQVKTTNKKPLWTLCKSGEQVKKVDFYILVDLTGVRSVFYVVPIKVIQYWWKKNQNLSEHWITRQNVIEYRDAFELLDK